MARKYRRYLNFKARVAEFVDYYDFTGLNLYTSSNKYWKETSHYSSIVGDSIARRLIDSSEHSNGFGRLVAADSLDELERTQIKYDMNWLPQIIETEGLMHIPARFVAKWRRYGQLLPSPIKSPPGEQNGFLIEGGQFTAERHDPDSKYRPGVWTHLNKDEHFIIQYELTSADSGRLLFKIRQDDNAYGLDWISYLVKIRAGENRGYLAGFATRDNPPLRIQYDRRALRHMWEGLGIYRVKLQNKAERSDR